MSQHQHEHEHTYRLLQERLDRHVAGAPASPALAQILRLLFAPGEAELALRLPTRLVAVSTLAKRLGMQRPRLESMLTDMAGRGLVFDLERDGERYFSLAPVVIGFYEFVFMRTRDNLPMRELARLFDEYLFQSGNLARSAFAGETQLARTLVREEALPADSHTEILDWERASRIVREARSLSVALCACRHERSLVGEACDAPLRTCLSLNHGAEATIRAGVAEPIDVPEAMRILEQSKSAGLMQCGDNVQQGVAFICNCCSCCCGLVAAIRRFDIPHAIVSSNWVAVVDEGACLGCGRCAAVCPPMALSVEAGESKGQGRAELRADLCLGCGLCVAACPRQAIRLQPRPRRVFTPRATVERLVAMAIERGKLADLAFDRPEALSERALAAIVSGVERSRPFKAAMAVRPLRSVFLAAVAAGARLSLGKGGRGL